MNNLIYQSAAASELLILSLDLVKNRVAVMGQEIRKAYIGQLLVGLIEKSSDVKVRHDNHFIPANLI